MPRTAANKQNVNITNNEVLKENSQNVFSQKTALTEDVQMITRGILPNIPATITIKALQRKDKKKVLMSNTDDVLLSLLQSCIVSPKDFNVYNLLPFESQYLLYRLRILTYGNENTFKDACPYCGEINEVTIDLNSIPIIDIPDDFKLTFDISLPVSGDVLTCKLLTEGELSKIRKDSKDFTKNTGNEDLDRIWESRIIAINGVTKLAPIEISQYLDEMSDYDSEYFMEYYSRYSGNYGLQTQLNYTCDHCNRKVESEMPGIATFFRPEFKIDKFI